MEEVILEKLKSIKPITRKGRLTYAVGTVLKAKGLEARIGQQCTITDKESNNCVSAEVVGITESEVVLMPLGDIRGIAQDSEINVVSEQPTLKFGKELQGKILDALGNVDGLGVNSGYLKEIRVFRDSTDPIRRIQITEPFHTGVKAIDGLLTMGIGQRTGIIAPAGAGKSTLLSMLAKHSNADITVIALIGERGREVNEFITKSLGREGLEKSVVVVSTSDRPAMERFRAAYTATTIAEEFSKAGKNVLLLMDSVTRFARALREIGLSIGEPPVRRGFPPSVFAELPKLFERAGNNDSGKITAFYTVLSETEDADDPIVEEVTSLLDGHIVLSRKLANSGHYPAIDILKSKSRLVDLITTESHIKNITKYRRLMSKYDELEFLIQIGEYKEGADNLADVALSKNKVMKEFLLQKTSAKYSFSEAKDMLENIINA